MPALQNPRSGDQGLKELADRNVPFMRRARQALTDGLVAGASAIKEGQTIDRAMALFLFVRDAGLADAVLHLPAHSSYDLAEFDRLPLVELEDHEYIPKAPEGWSRCKVGGKWVILLGTEAGNLFYRANVEGASPHHN